jgi:hypothetical protein
MKCEKCDSSLVEGYFEIDGCAVVGDTCDNCKTVENLRTITQEIDKDEI